MTDQKIDIFEQIISSTEKIWKIINVTQFRISKENC